MLLASRRSGASVWDMSGVIRVLRGRGRAFPRSSLRGRCCCGRGVECDVHDVGELFVLLSTQGRDVAVVVRPGDVETSSDHLPSGPAR